MDPATINLITANAVALLSSYLAKAAETVIPKAAEDLYSAIRGRLSAKPAAQEALADLEAAPEDADAQAAVRLQLKKELVEDEEFRRAIETLLERAKESGSKPAISATGRSVASGGDISGTVLTGDVKGSVSIGGARDENDPASKP